MRQQLKRLENCAHRVDRWLTIKHTLLTLAVTSLLTTTAFADPIHDAAMNGDIAGVLAFVWGEPVIDWLKENLWLWLKDWWH